MEDRLLIPENNGAPKNLAALSRAAKYKLDLEVKDMDRVLDQSLNRSFSTDQRISIEGLFLQKQLFKHQQKETSMVAMISHERAISSQIELAERRAVQRCKRYDATIMHWKVVDKLLEKQVERRA